MKKTYALIIIGFLIVLALLFVKTLILNQTVQPEKANTPLALSPTLSAPKNVDYQARFAIFTNGTKRIFTAVMYHNLSKDVYIEASDPSIVYVKEEGITWMDFFLTLPFKLDKNCLTTGTNETFCTTRNATLKFYLNGERKDDLLFTPIRNGDVALISYGSQNEEQIKSQLNLLKNPK